MSVPFSRQAEADDYFPQAVEIAKVNGGLFSTPFLQRKLRIGYFLAARLVEMAEERNMLTEKDGARPRKLK